MARVLTDSDLLELSQDLAGILTYIQATEASYIPQRYRENPTYKARKLGVLNMLRHIADVLEGVN